MPLVEGCGQEVRVTYALSGRVRRELSRVRKAFLIDRAGDMRDLQLALPSPEIVLDVIKTLLMEKSLRSSPASTTRATIIVIRSIPFAKRPCR